MPLRSPVWIHIWNIPRFGRGYISGSLQRCNSPWPPNSGRGTTSPLKSGCISPSRIRECLSGARIAVIGQPAAEIGLKPIPSVLCADSAGSRAR